MSMHRSLAVGKRARRHRNVLAREERIAKLAEEGRWDESRSVYGLPKVRSIKVVAGKKKSKKEAAEKAGEAAEGAAGEGAEGAAPPADGDAAEGGK